MFKLSFLTVWLVVVFCSMVRFSVNAQSTENLVLFGRGTYPGDDSTFDLIRNAGFTTFMLSSFYIRSNGDVYSGDDNRHSIIQDGRYTGDKSWPGRIASLRKRKGTIGRIEVLLEGRWFNQAPNTYDFIRDWLDSSKAERGVVAGMEDSSTLYKILKVFKDDLGVDAICIDDESVYDSLSIVRLSTMTQRVGMKMTLCPFTRKAYWKYILDNAAPGVVDAVYLQCYDGGRKNTPGPWIQALGDKVPVYPIFLCRGAFGTCAADHNSKTPSEIQLAMQQYKIESPSLAGGGIWQLADVKGYIRMNCAGKDSTSGTAVTEVKYLQQLKKALELNP